MKTYSRTKQWKIEQRHQYRKGTLSAKRIDLLEKIPGWKWELYGISCSFEEARTFARSLGFKEASEWSAYIKINRPEKYPLCPEVVYKHEGWISWGDFLGTRPGLKTGQWRPFEDARAFVRTLGFQSHIDWDAYIKSGKLPYDIPPTPWAATQYASEWLSVPDWLGTRIGFKQGAYRPFEAARTYARSLHLKNITEWLKVSQGEDFPSDIPGHPLAFYRDKGWISWGDFLGTGNQKGGWRAFEDAREFVRTLGIKNTNEWYRYAKSQDKPGDIPKCPMNAYATSGWVSMEDWIGTRVGFARGKYRPFIDARDYARQLHLKNKEEWTQYYQSHKLPVDVPSNPWNTYADNGWKNIFDWLGLSEPVKFLPFVEARGYVRTLNLERDEDWKIYCRSGKLPPNIPKHPHAVYKNDGWVSLYDWLGTRVGFARGKYKPFVEARIYARSLKLKSMEAWVNYRRTIGLPVDIPSCPEGWYEEWNGWGDWLGNGYIATVNRIYRPFKKMRAFVRALGLNSGEEWETYCKSGKKPDDIPMNLREVYKENWTSTGDVLGHGRIASQDRVYVSFGEAKRFARSRGIKTKKEWFAFCKSGKKPDNIPTNLLQTYEKQWRGFPNFLANGNESYAHNLKKTFRPFEAGRKYARSLNLKTQKQWYAFGKSGRRPDDIPTTPNKTYKSQWISWYDWMGTTH